MKNVFFVTLFALSTLTGFSQLKVKKSTVYVNDVEVLRWDKGNPAMEGSTCVVNTVKTGEPAFSMRQAYHDGWYNLDINFVDFPEEARVKVLYIKNLFEDMYKMKVFDDEGKINEANARKYCRLYDIIKDRKIIIQTQ